MVTVETIKKDFNENKDEWKEMLDAATKAKHDSCSIKDAYGKGKHGFDYFKMNEMRLRGLW